METCNVLSFERGDAVVAIAQVKAEVCAGGRSRDRVEGACRWRRGDGPSLSKLPGPGDIADVRDPVGAEPARCVVGLARRGHLERRRRGPGALEEIALEGEVLSRR